MTDENAIMRDTLSTIRSELDRRRISMKVCAAKGGFPYSTFLSWFPAGGTPQLPSLANLPGLVRALPTDLADMLLPDGYRIAPDPSGLNYDEFAEKCHDFLQAKEKAHRADSPGGPAIVEEEEPALKGAAARLAVAK